MNIQRTRYVPKGYTDNRTTPLLIQGLSGLDMIDILDATQLSYSIPDIEPSFNDHVPLIRSHICYFQETDFYQAPIWKHIIYPYIVTRLAAHLTKKVII